MNVKQIKMMIRVALLLVALVLTGCVETPGAGNSAFIESDFIVASGEKQTVTVILRERQILDGSLSVSGQENTIDFYIKDPDGGLAYGNVRIVGGQNFEVRAQKAGSYTIYLDNSISFGLPRQVALRYHVR